MHCIVRVMPKNINSYIEKQRKSQSTKAKVNRIRPYPGDARAHACESRINTRT